MIDTSSAKPGGMAESRSNLLRGILLMCASAIAFPLMNALAKHLSAEYDSGMVVWARSAGHLLFVLALFAPGRGASLWSSQRPWLQLVQSSMLLVATGSFFVALKYVPLAEASAITFTAPLMVTALSVPLLGEAVGPRRWLAVLIGFAGALVLIRPGAEAVHWGSLLVLVTAAAYALYQITVRRVARHDPPQTTLTYGALLGTLALTLLLPWIWRQPDSLLDIALLAGLGLLGGLGQYCVVQALRWGPAAVLSPFNYGQLLGAAVLGFFLFGEVPVLWTWLGAGIIVASGLYIALRETRTRPQSRKQ